MRRQAIVLLAMTGLIMGVAFASASPPVPTSPQGRSAGTPANSLRQMTGPVKVSDISIKDGEAGQTFVDVATSGAATFRVSRLESPRRLVVDVQDARSALARNSYAAHSSLLKGVRVGQFRENNPAVLRVVADLMGDPAFDVHAISGGIRIELRAREAHAQVVRSEPVKGLTASVPPLVVAKPAAAPQQSSSPVPDSTAAPAKPAKETAKLDYQKALPPGPGSDQVAAAPQSAAPDQTPEALQAANAAATIAATSFPSSTADAQAAAPAAGGQTAEQPKYTGEPISVNLKDVDLKDFFRLIHEISGLNIIVDPNVAGSVTLVLDAVPWDQALDIVLKNNGLGRVLEGNVLRIARLDTLTAEQGATAKLAAARQEAMPLVTIFHPVNYAKATDIQAMIKGWIGGGALTSRGSILVDQRTNTLIISDVQTQIPIIENIIGKLDKKAKQVVIEARIVLATTSFSRSLASALSGLAFGASNHTGVGAATGTGSSASATIPNSVPSPPSVTASPATASGFGTFTIMNSSAHGVIEAAIAAAETTSQAKTISRPTIITQNNVSGTVTQGTQVPIQTTINNTISITYQNASLTLTVTPQVTDDGNVFLIINVQNSSVGAVLTSAGPSINTQQAQTQVLVPDGGTVVFGGVTVTARSKSASYVPLLGNIPILGNLFKSWNVQDSDQELLFFVTPKIVMT